MTTHDLKSPTHDDVVPNLKREKIMLHHIENGVIESR